jgi:hypothetical protein
MRKHLLGPVRPTRPLSDQDWLDLERLAQVEVTSEDASHPIESALLPGAESGWRAARPGAQTIRLIFDQPQRLRRIWLLFIEAEIPRTQEFVLRWSPDGRWFQDIVRQQWNFSPRGATREAEDYHVDLSGVTALELTIIPDQSGGDAHASLAEWRLSG